MMTFDRVLPEMIRVCHEDTVSKDSVATYCVVRDVRGRVRLIVAPKNGTKLALDLLQTTLGATLGAYFVAPIISATSKGEVQRLAKLILEKAKGKWPTAWPRSFRNMLGGSETPIDSGERWIGIERTIGKEAWFATTPPVPPWPIVKGKTPPIVTFHSFKGGVGRTMLVAAYAIRLASETPPQRVAVVDLDLEAPGVGSLLGSNTERGVLDVLIDYNATGSIDLAGASTPAQLEGAVGQGITVFSAGRVDDLYVQKIARLDFSSTEPGTENPVGVALTAMLNKMKNDFDVILLDSRAGLHDLAGMSLHGLAHVDVLVFRGTEQNLTGMEQVLRTLGARGTPQIVLVENLLPTGDNVLFETRRLRTREQVYELLCKYVYPEDNPPQLVDSGDPHDVISVRRKEWLDGLDSFKEHIADVLKEDEFNKVALRIDECIAESASSNEDDAEDNP